jgi:phosphate-selective porin OprO/OprP
VIPVISVVTLWSSLAMAAGVNSHGVQPYRPAITGYLQEPAQEPPKQRRTEKPPKERKARKVPKPAPDEDIDPEADTVERAGRYRFIWNNHPSFRFGSAFRLDMEAQLQEDAHASYAGADLKAGLKPMDLHRNRVGIQGNLFKHIQYEVKRELTEKEVDASTLEKCAIDPTLKGCVPKSLWKDVYLDLTYIKRAQVQIGKFKVPFGLDELTGVTHNDFVYRSLGATYLAPARDIGAMVHGSFRKKTWNYWTGVFRHDGDNAHSSKIQGGDLTFAARAAGLPFAKADGGRSGLQVGAAVATSALSDDSYRPNGLQGRTVMTQDTFYSPVFVKGHRRRLEGDVDWTAGPVSARSELTWVSDDRLHQGIAGDDLPDARARAWYVSGTWILTGEQKTRPIKPADDFLHGGLGAIELAGRVERLWFDSAGGTDLPTRANRSETILPSGNQVLTLGVNWTLNRFVKLQFNGIREHVEDSGRNPVSDRAPSFWSRVLRLQLVL